ncbi:MAG: hypothetical protein JWN67_1472 [Actinomycetia bacterium]|nr:hypothetical protein [Actinomycetes bacterium]
MAFGATEPWAFTQVSPLSTDEFAKAAKVRGVQVSDGVLAELWRIGALAPYIEIVDVPVAPPAVPLAAEPRRTSSYTTAVRLACSEGRLTDPTVTGYRPDFEFRRLGVSATVWWNGLLYSRWQLVAPRWLQPIFAAHATPDRHGNTLRLRDLASWERSLADDAHRRTNLVARQLLPTLLGRIDAAINDPTLPVSRLDELVERPQVRRALRDGQPTRSDLKWGPWDLNPQAVGLKGRCSTN